MNPPAATLEVAATVVLVRDGTNGPETLMLERPSDRGSFAGAWVFPGGRVDPEDSAASEPDDSEHDTPEHDCADHDSPEHDPAEHDSEGRLPADVSPAGDEEPVAGGDEEQSARRAAVRELHEETGLTVAVADIHLISCWTPPLGIPRRFRTWFYLAKAPAGEITLSADEAVDHAWIRPIDALDAHSAGRLQLVAPTWVTLHLLAETDNLAGILSRAASTPEIHFRTRHSEQGNVLLWEPDVAYSDDGMLEASGPRHRLEITRLPWVYTRSVNAAQATG
ncbi:NUDIX hydrolase [Homoserinimonas sp. OAct 916]|uniref:NUDIX hydrolase n=1 Tax=Homoserinimonas sp. OAct 916 TaxID=2211450 RepID=UPI0013004BBE|nr:NUDIX hydrolase [Homoserinimonas sp. OAct 916]